MPRKRQAKAQSVDDTRSSVEDTRTPEEIAEERIASWRKGDFLDLGGLRLKQVPETLRKVRDLEYIYLHNNEIQELPPWIGELSVLRGS
jgi:hypothetical protein